MPGSGGAVQNPMHSPDPTTFDKLRGAENILREVAHPTIRAPSRVLLRSLLGEGFSVLKNGATSHHRPQRTTTFVPDGTLVPGAGACSRTVPLPVIWTWRPWAAVISITVRMGRPTSEGTLSFLPSLMAT